MMSSLSSLSAERTGCVKLSQDGGQFWETKYSKLSDNNRYKKEEEKIIDSKQLASQWTKTKDYHKF